MKPTEPMELNEKVARLCGIKPTTECPECWGSGYGGSEMDHIPCDECKTTGKVAPHYVAPNYASDLNACASFERDVLLKDVRLYLEYARKLSATHGALDAIFATAEQRCRAFIAVMEEQNAGA